MISMNPNSIGREKGLQKTGSWTTHSTQELSNIIHVSYNLFLKTKQKNTENIYFSYVERKMDWYKDKPVNAGL